MKACSSWKQLLTEPALAQLDRWVTRNKLDCADISAGSRGAGSTLCVRQKAGRRGGELRLGLDVFVPEALAIVKEGFVFRIEAQLRLRVQGSKLLPATSFGFNRDAFAACLLSPHGKTMHDRQLIQTLFVGMNARADSLPPVMLASPNHLGARQLPDELATLINDEVEMGWINPGRPFPSHLPFICGPTSVVAKPGTDKLRKVNDVVHPRPQSYDSLYGGRSLAPKAHSVLGPEACVEYGSIQNLASDVAILCDLACGSGYLVVGANRDYANWYRQTPIAKRNT